MARGPRPVVAAVLALVAAGLGHVYLRRWGRAIAWFLTVVATGFVLLTLFADPSAGVDDWPLVVVLPVVGLFVLSAIDAYRLAVELRDRNRRAEAEVEGGGATCPNCGRDIDPELDFCHWCTERRPTGARTDAADADDTHPEEP